VTVNGIDQECELYRYHGNIGPQRGTIVHLGNGKIHLNLYEAGTMTFQQPPQHGWQGLLYEMFGGSWIEMLDDAFEASTSDDKYTLIIERLYSLNQTTRTAWAAFTIYETATVKEVHRLYVMRRRVPSKDTTAA